ncbi:hypothetical protein GN956_G26450 [Arapaima gigas]
MLVTVRMSLYFPSSLIGQRNCIKLQKQGSHCQKRREKMNHQKIELFYKIVSEIEDDSIFPLKYCLKNKVLEKPADGQIKNNHYPIGIILTPHGYSNCFFFNGESTLTAEQTDDFLTCHALHASASRSLTLLPIRPQPSKSIYLDRSLRTNK